MKFQPTALPNLSYNTHTPILNNQTKNLAVNPQAKLTVLNWHNHSTNVNGVTAVTV
jgi:hypothetical protein